MANLRAQIEEDHLTCTICYNVFNNPKALPCLHTFCEHCVREYVVSRGYESAGEFPCPICRATIQIPAGGIDQFPNNHLVKSLSHTVDQSRPVPKPRRSLQPKAEEAKLKGGADVSDEPPPPYTEAVAYEGPQLPQGCAHPAQTDYGWREKAGPPDPQPPHNPPLHYPSQSHPDPGGAPALTTAQPYHGGMLYPSIPPSAGNTPSPACSLGMLLQFGKKGASITDFHKPLGLAVSDCCDFVVTDSGSSGNRIFVYDYQGQPKKAFQCDCRIKDVAVNSKNEIVVVVNKPAATFRCYDMSGRCLGEYGKSITHEEANGVALMSNGGVVITGKQNYSVYILTDQYKLSTKFGRKGTGDGYFQSPAFVAIDTKDHIIVTDDVNHSVQVFNSQGKFKSRFGSKGSGPGQLLHPMGLVTDANDNIIVADSGNCRVEMFSSRGAYLRTIVSGTDQLGEEVRPVNVALTPKGDIAVLLRGNYFAEVRVFSPLTSSDQGSILVKESSNSTWYFVN